MTLITKIIPYGTQHDVTVLEASPNMITVVDENNEGYFLMWHGLKNLPNKGDRGKITFVKHTNVTKGYWEYSPRS